MTTDRDDFSAATKRKLGLRVGYRCSIEWCDAQTVGPSAESEQAVSSIGVAAHICAAAPGGPRYRPEMTSEERIAIENGIWLCQSHSKLIDDDKVSWPEARLRDIKRTAELRAGVRLGAFATASSVRVDGAAVGHIRTYRCVYVAALVWNEATLPVSIRSVELRLGDRKYIPSKARPGLTLDGCDWFDPGPLRLDTKDARLGAWFFGAGMSGGQPVVHIEPGTEAVLTLIPVAGEPITLNLDFPQLDGAVDQGEAVGSGEPLLVAGTGARDEGSDTLRRARDLARVRELLRFVNAEAIDELVEKAPLTVPRHAFYFQPGFAKQWTSSVTHFYDAALRGHFQQLHEPWLTVVSNLGYHAAEVPGREELEWRFEDCEHQRHHDENQARYDAAESTLPMLRDALLALTRYLHEHYVEVDLHEAIRDSWARHRAELARDGSRPPSHPTDLLELRREPAVASVELTVEYRTEAMHRGDGGHVSRHDYVLAVALVNRSTRTFRHWHIDVEMPSALRRSNMTYAHQVRARPNGEQLLFRWTSDDRGPLRPGDTIPVEIPYMVDDDVYHRHRATISEGIVRASAFVDDERAGLVERGVNALQNF